MRAVPAVGNTKPMSSFSVVVFPAPLGPRKPKISPSSTVRCNGFKACFGFLRQKPTVYVFSNPRISIAAMRDSDGSRTKLYSKFKAIESGRAVTEVTKGSCCSRTRIVGVSRRPLEHRSLCSTWSQAFFGWTSPSCASTQGERGSVGRGKLGMLTGGRWISCYSGTRGRRPAAPLPGRCSPGQHLLAGPFVPSAAGFSVRRPVYGESRSGFVWLLPLLPPRHGRLLH